MPCLNCDDTGWVCENHPSRPARGDSTRADACDCGAAKPCLFCNPAGGFDEPPIKTGIDGVDKDGRKRH